jgi:hypothetical protein
LYLRAREGDETVALQEVENALPKQIRNDTYVISVVERISKVYAFIAIGLVIQRQGGQHPQFDTRGITVFLHRSNDLDCTLGLFLLVPRFHNFAKRSLS